MTYLTIITTILVITQIIRVTQNHISLMRQEKKNDISEQDFKTQREVFYMLHEILDDMMLEKTYGPLSDE